MPRVGYSDGFETYSAVHCQFTFQTLHATSKDGSSLEFVAATAGKECYIQNARGRGLCPGSAGSAKHYSSTCAIEESIYINIMRKNKALAGQTMA